METEGKKEGEEKLPEMKQAKGDKKPDFEKLARKLDIQGTVQYKNLSNLHTIITNHFLVMTKDQLAKVQEQYERTRTG